MSMSGLLFVPVIAAASSSAQFRDALHLLPDLPLSDSDRDQYTPDVLRAETGSLTGLVSVLATTTSSLHWATLVAHHAAQSSSALRSAGWSLDERHAVNPVRAQLQLAARHTRSARAALEDANRHALALHDLLHPVDVDRADS